ncbi:hypothetical protein QG516_12345 [Pedobacter gandavensis]|uniref:hypothetical protein n=1 Tax=Pedobacter gandavensis TaxID=2679963 RepID=UPI002479B4EE|nr:hypothetical protein [Pedobacter gandavensis]WGQ12415.1 hypothetical protein QG516_12345 [Pedobacter gandavensis]
MKKLIIPLAISASLVFMGVKNVNAQITTLETVIIKGNTTEAVVSERVSNSFNELFKEATAPKWFEVNKRFVVNFILNDQKNKAVFTKTGELVYHLSYGSEKDVPDQIRKKIQNQYKDYNITSGIKVRTANVTLWVLNIENSKQILVIRAADDDISVIDRIKKMS